MLQVDEAYDSMTWYIFVTTSFWDKYFFNNERAKYYFPFTVSDQSSQHAGQEIMLFSIFQHSPISNSETSIFLNIGIISGKYASRCFETYMSHSFRPKHVLSSNETIILRWVLFILHMIVLAGWRCSGIDEKQDCAGLERLATCILTSPSPWISYLPSHTCNYHKF